MTRTRLVLTIALVSAIWAAVGYPFSAQVKRTNTFHPGITGSIENLQKLAWMAPG